MTEYDYSPGAYNQYLRTQQRIANWADDTAQCASQYKSPFVPRSDVQNNFYNQPRSASSSRSPPPSRSGHHGRSTPQRTNGNVRSPLRSQTIAVSPDDSISQVSGPSHRHRSSGGGHRRARSHSPTRHSSSRSSRSQSHSHRSGHRTPTTYVVSPTAQYGGMQYVQAPQPVQYVQQQAQPQPAAYVVYPHDRKVQIVYQEPPQYPPVAHPTQEHHGGGLLRRIFGSQSGHGRSRSVSVPRSSSRR